MTHCIGGHDDKPFVKGSSKPKFEETLEMKIRKSITDENVFKEGGDTLEVLKIADICVDSAKEVDSYMQKWNYEFDGSLRIEILVDSLKKSNVKRMKGNAYVENGEVVELSEIQIYNMYG